jgi:hypothetical protein
MKGTGKESSERSGKCGTENLFHLREFKLQFKFTLYSSIFKEVYLTNNNCLHSSAGRYLSYFHRLAMNNDEINKGVQISL